MLVCLNAFCNSPTISLFGPISMEFQFQEVLLGHIVNPSWCLLVNTKYLAPEDLTVSTNSLGSKYSAVNWKRWLYQKINFIANILSEIRVRRSWFVVFLHEVYNTWIRLRSFPIPPHPFGSEWLLNDKAPHHKNTAVFTFQKRNDYQSDGSDSDSCQEFPLNNTFQRKRSRNKKESSWFEIFANLFVCTFFFWIPLISDQREHRLPERWNRIESPVTEDAELWVIVPRREGAIVKWLPIRLKNLTDKKD